MTVRFYKLRDDREGWDVVGEVSDGEFDGEERYREELEAADVDLTDEDALVETFDSPYFNARKVEEEDEE